MIRRPPRSTLFPYHDALPIFHDGRLGQWVVAPQADPALGAWRELRRGDFVEIEGRTVRGGFAPNLDRKSTRLNSSHANISYAVFCLKKKQRTLRAVLYCPCRL